MVNQNLTLQSPWVTYFKMVYNLLTVDPEIKMPKSITEGEDGKCSFWIESPNATKIIALSKILKNEIQMGNITITISFRCVNNELYRDLQNDRITGSDFTDAFTGNPLFSKVVTEVFPGGAKVYYAVFKREIITFFNDNMTDYHANSHFIVADIVKEIANEDSAVNVCTEYE